MKMNVKLASLFMLVVMVFVPMQTAAAKGLADGRVLFGRGTHTRLHGVINRMTAKKAA